MRTIKFRGRGIDTGKFVYGFYYEKSGNSFIFDPEHDLEWIVAPESVAQLVGYDKDGKEVYEGDILVDSDGDEFNAHLLSIATAIHKCYFIQEQQERFPDVVLKETNNEI